MTPTLPDGETLASEIREVVREHWTCFHDEEDCGNCPACKHRAAALAYLSEITLLQQELSAAKRERDEARADRSAEIEAHLTGVRLSGFREGVEAAAKVVGDKIAAMRAEIETTPSSNHRATLRYEIPEVWQPLLESFRSLSPPVEATDESVSPPAIESSEEMVKREIGWLIERRDRGAPEWWAFPTALGEWTRDASQALRFARKIDAENYGHAAGLDDPGFTTYTTEHIWT